ncbi:MAG TPA: hypothetical protein VII78_13055 [Myxococcota bacterium]|jgi:hypothetical protein
MLDLVQLVSTAAFIVSGSAVGIRLLLLAWRTRELTDFTIACALVVLAGITYPLMLAGALGGFALEPTRWMLIASGFTGALGFGAVAAFTQRAFRPHAAWAHALSGVLIAMLGYSAVASMLSAQHAGDFEALRSPRSPLVWTRVAAVAIYLWTSFEGLRCWVQARRRLALGLADPLVVNRFLLWALIGAFALCSVAPALVLTLAGKQPLDYPMTRLTTGVAGVATAVAMQLSFLPPASYRRWVLGHATA